MANLEINNVGGAGVGSTAQFDNLTSIDAVFLSQGLVTFNGSVVFTNIGGGVTFQASVIINGGLQASNASFSGNVEVAGNATFSDITVLNRHKWSLTNSTSQIIASTGNIILNWDVNLELVGVSHATVTTSSIVTISQSGNYIVGFNLQLGTNASGAHALEITRNGSVIVGENNPPSTNTPWTTHVTVMESFSANDTISISGRTLAAGGQQRKIKVGTRFPRFWGFRI